MSSTSVPKEYRPEYWGPGHWHLFHSQSYLARDQASQKQFIELFLSSLAYLPCAVCRKHASKYVETYPIHDVIGKPDRDGEDHMGMFEWVWRMHNAVNHRLGKPMLEYHFVKKRFVDGSVCEEMCAVEDQSQMASQTVEKGDSTKSFFRVSTGTDWSAELGQQMGSVKPQFVAPRRIK